MSKRIWIALYMSVLYSLCGTAHSVDLIVDPDTTRTITASEENMVLGNLVLGDRAKIVFAPDVDHWEVFAERATFGEDATIDARGAAGGNGVNGNKGRSTNTPGKYGEPGQPGQAGETGKTGVDLYFRIRIANFGGVQVDNSGGTGGIGGNGGAGGKSGDARCSDRKKARNGERGGNAARGGNGGNGGTIEFRYTSATGGFSIEESDRLGTLVLPGITFVSEGGEGNIAGVPGKGGAGGKGKGSCIPKMGGGKRGSNGSKAEGGSAGLAGSITIIKDDFKSAKFPTPEDLNRKEEATFYVAP